MTCYVRALLMMLCLLEDSDKPVDVGGHTDWWGDQDSAPQGLVGAGYKLSDSSKKAAQTKLSALFLAFWGWKKKLQKDGSSPPTGTTPLRVTPDVAGAVLVQSRCVPLHVTCRRKVCGGSPGGWLRGDKGSS